MRSSRRALLGAGLLAAANACTPSSATSSATGGGSASAAPGAPSATADSTAGSTQVPSPGAPALSPTASAAPSPSPTPGPAAVPGREEVVSRYTGRAPAWFALEGEGIVSTTAAEGVCLTFDACGGPGGSGVDAALLDFLLDQQVPFTAFLNARWIEANPRDTQRLAQAAAAGRVELGNHGTAHRPLSVTGQSAYQIPGTANPAEVYDEIMGCQQLLEQVAGTRARWFRPGTAHWDDVAVAIAAGLGLRAAGFSLNADGGATFSRRAVAQAVGGVQNGDVVIAHLNQPTAATGAGMLETLPALLAAGTRFLTLSAAAGA